MVPPDVKDDVSLSLMGRMWNNFFLQNLSFCCQIYTYFCWFETVYSFASFYLHLQRDFDDNNPKLIAKEKYFVTLLGFTEQKLVHLFMDSYGKISNHPGSLSMKLMIVDLSSTTQNMRQICN